MVELLPHRSAELVALNSLGRNVFATVGSAVGQPLISAIGNGWSMTMMASVALASVAGVLLIKRHGFRWREDLKALDQKTWTS